MKSALVASGSAQGPMELELQNMSEKITGVRYVGRYVIFGALAATASTEDLVAEIETLSDNTLEVLEVVAPYLN